jgi:hypothetical protein
MFVDGSAIVGDGGAQVPAAKHGLALAVRPSSPRIIGSFAQ